MSHIAWSRVLYGTGGNARGISYNCTDGNDGGTALAHLPAGKFDMFPRLWKLRFDPFLLNVDIHVLILMNCYPCTGAGPGMLCQSNS